MTPTVLLALVEVMSPQELINNLAALQRRGAMENPDLKAAIEDKLEAAKTAGRVSAFKAEEAMKAAPLSTEVRRKLEQVADSQVKARGAIKRPTALLVDKSGSMQVAIELGKRIAAMISAICENDLFVYAFDTMAYPIDRSQGDLAAWEKSFKGIAAGGGTACGAPLELMIRKKQYVEQIIMVTDEGDNTPPLFCAELEKVPGDHDSRSERLLCQDARGGGPARTAMPRRTIDVRCVPVYRRLLCAAESGAARFPALEAGIADGDHGLSASRAEAR
jgi:hypothetical protein